MARSKIETVAKTGQTVIDGKEVGMKLYIGHVHMDFIEELFEKGLGGLDAVLSQFLAINQNSQYTFNLERAELSIEFKEDRKQHSEVLDHAAVLDFEQRLGFVQFEEKAREHNIGQYLAVVQGYRRSLAVMCDLHTLGHPDWKLTTKHLIVGPASGRSHRQIATENFL